MAVRLFSIRVLELATAVAAVTLLAGCPPDTPRTEVANVSEAPGTYLAAPNKIFDKDNKFDLRWKVIYEQKTADEKFNPGTNQTNRDLAIGRCTRCHECGFPRAFDLEHYGTLDWKPQYKGQQWSAPTKRMIAKEDSLLNETVAMRIYSFLRDETLGKYDETKDNKGAVVIEK